MKDDYVRERPPGVEIDSEIEAAYLERPMGCINPLCRRNSEPPTLEGYAQGREIEVPGEMRFAGERTRMIFRECPVCGAVCTEVLVLIGVNKRDIRLPVYVEFNEVVRHDLPCNCGECNSRGMSYGVGVYRTGDINAVSSEPPLVRFYARTEPDARHKANRWIIEQGLVRVGGQY